MRDMNGSRPRTLSRSLRAHSLIGGGRGAHVGLELAAHDRPPDHVAAALQSKIQIDINIVIHLSSS